MSAGDRFIAETRGTRVSWVPEPTHAEQADRSAKVYRQFADSEDDPELRSQLLDISLDWAVIARFERQLGGAS